MGKKAKRNCIYNNAWEHERRSYRTTNFALSSSWDAWSRKIRDIVASGEAQKMVHGIGSVLLWALNATEKKVWRFILSGDKHVHINAATENRRNSTKTPQTSFFMANLRSTSKWFARVIFGFGERYWSLWVEKQPQLHVQHFQHWLFMHLTLLTTFRHPMLLYWRTVD